MSNKKALNKFLFQNEMKTFTNNFLNRQKVKTKLLFFNIYVKLKKILILTLILIPGSNLHKKLCSF